MIPTYDPIYLIITGLAMLVSQLVGAQMQRAFAKYSQEPMPVTGREIAERMLRENGINDVQVQAAQGMLTDHYDPAGKTVNLSEPVYGSATVAAAAVAAHECGHAVQHAKRALGNFARSWAAQHPEPAASGTTRRFFEQPRLAPP